jgi:hypothetical protein
MFFIKGLKDSTLICKLAMKNPRTSEEMFSIANKYAMAKEATLKTRESKKDKKSSHSDLPGTCKSNDKKGEADHLVANVERPRHSRTEYLLNRANMRGSWTVYAYSTLGKAQDSRLQEATWFH